MKSTSRSGAAQLAGLAVTAALCIPFCGASAEAVALSRKAMNRVIAWHLAKGLAVEFAVESGPGTTQKPTPSKRPRGLPRTSISGTYFVSSVLRFHPECRRYLAPFHAGVAISGGEAIARVTWSEGGQQRSETEAASWRRP